MSAAIVGEHLGALKDLAPCGQSWYYPLGVFEGCESFGPLERPLGLRRVELPAVSLRSGVRLEKSKASAIKHCSHTQS
jgi:hypothetical protein